MKKHTILALTLVLSFVLGGVAMAAVDDREEQLLPMCQSVPDPEEEPCIYTGDAYYECGQLGLEDLDWAKRVGPQSREWILMDQGDLVEVVTTSVLEQRTKLNWYVGEEGVEDYDPVGAVLVKAEGKGMLPGGDIPKLGGYTIFIYDPPAHEDSGLYSYYRELPNGDEHSYQIDHITFCWTHVDENGNEVCYQEETAWAAGPGYIGANQWATYFAYPDGLVDILAGQYMDAGYLTFGTPYVDEEGKNVVVIDITLENGFVFYYDWGDAELDDNLKVQDYEFPPEGNPAIGLFDWKVSVEPGSTTASIVVPVNNFYGVHLDVAYPLDECP